MIKKLDATIAVAEALATVSGLPVGRGQKPQGEPPYYILYSLDTTLDGAPYTDENEDAELIHQVTSVSGPSSEVISSTGYQDQTEWMADKARETFLERDPVTRKWKNELAIPGYRAKNRSLETEPGGTSDPSDVIISYVQRFKTIWTLA